MARSVQAGSTIEELGRRQATWLDTSPSDAIHHFVHRIMFLNDILSQTKKILGGIKFHSNFFILYSAIGQNFIINFCPTRQIFGGTHRGRNLCDISYVCLIICHYKFWFFFFLPRLLQESYWKVNEIWNTTDKTN